MKFQLLFYGMVFYLTTCMPFAYGQKMQAGMVRISGRVMQATHPLDGATVSFFDTVQPYVLLQQTQSDRAGMFSMQLPQGSCFLLEITYTGMHTLRTGSTCILQSDTAIMLGDLIPEPKTGTTLADAVVIHQRPAFEQKDGVLTYHLSAAAMAESSSGAELIKNMPMVSTDPEGRLLIKGRQPIVLIDDKPVEMNGRQLTELLESLPGGAIERIELMQHPPPQFAGSEGAVINIVTKKGAIGWTGKLSVQAGTIGQSGANIHASFRNKKMAFTGVASMQAAQVYGNSFSQRTNQFKDSANELLTTGTWNNNNLRPNVRLQFDYTADSRNQWSFVIQGNGNDFNNSSATIFEHVNQWDTVWKRSLRKQDADGLIFSLQTQASYTYTGKTKTEKLQVNMSYTPQTTQNNQLYLQQFYGANGVKNSSDSLQQQTTSNNGGTGAWRLHYQKPVGKKGGMINGGGHMQLLHQHNILQSYWLNDTTGIATPVPLLSTNNTFRQVVVAARMGMQIKVNSSWHLQYVLQVEHTHFDIRFANAEAAVSNDYFSWLPSVTVRKDFNKEIRSSWVYRKTIRRPGMHELNPAVDYSDPYNLRLGNPGLLPSMAHQFDWNLNWNNGKSYVNTTLGFNRVEDIINRIRMLAANGNTYATFLNVASRNEYEAGIWSGYSFSPHFRLNVSASFLYNTYGEKEKESLGYRNGSNVSLNVNGQWVISRVFSLDGGIRYQAFADPQGRSRSNAGTQTTLQYKMLNRRLILGATAIDPFTRQEITAFASAPNFSVSSSRTVITRNFRLSVAWVLQPGNNNGTKSK